MSLVLSPFAVIVILGRKLVNGMYVKKGSGKQRQKLQLLLPVDQRQFNYLDTEPRFSLLLFVMIPNMLSVRIL